MSAQNSDPKRIIGRPIQKGQVLNPGGRPKIPEDVKEAARAHTKAAIETLAAIMGDAEANPSARVRAAESLLDRAWGRAESTVNVKDVRDVRDLSRAEILAALATYGIAAEGTGAEQPGAVH